MKKTMWIGLVLSIALMFGGCGKSVGSFGSDQLSDAESNPSDSAKIIDFVPSEIHSRFIMEDEVESDDRVLYLTMATTGNWEGLLRGELIRKYSEKLYEWSDGSMVLTTYYDGIFGTDLEMTRGVMEGTLCIVNAVPTYQTEAVPQAALLDIPGTFETVDEYNTFINNYYMSTLQTYYKKSGIRLLSSSAYDFRVMTANRPVDSLDDLKGLKLRTMESKYPISFWQSMGAVVTPLDWAQVRVAIQQGLVEAQENPLGYMISSKLSDIQDHVILTNHVPMISNYIMNEEQYQNLTAEQQELLLRMFDEMSRELAARQHEENEAFVQDLEDRGCVVKEPSEDIVDAIQVSRQVQIDLLRKDLGDDVVDDFLDKVEAAKHN